MKIIDVVAAIIEKNGKILLAQRDAGSDQAGLWEFPGGKVEAGESQPQALARELEEELGIVASVGSYVASNQWQQSERIIRLHAWRVATFSGELQNRCHSDFVWLAPEQAFDYPLAPADVPLLTAYIATQRAKV
ncbi:MAG: pyrimidine (deoxy)nucleoside triphosphate diphosphatase [Serratia proteamaculans]|jgi:(d)CTP diphosphatase|uniref:pyrimidine (deoxy)nucleoside triphosphate diphosphatase n=1 Tax=Serratia proteamaculans TaxID=28151 RepID=UPI000D887887|nr:pyrimidine (deoxy)nucleoside triphosphate diphosphatase [Serratia proteamaculans]SPZ53809.1 CTP pyrophosphohydrolase [Serratia quinivorans]NWA71512.1 pyrimidine (deoxy)nucleoside triphosphate diphosphatase [Serratia proteamaculans]CAI0749189.1 CTP pyrophosphohydrolase [Serratia proteamaculans]CAI0777841.1 CTP pyrophosphohydrolase [Serratia proteamaculans]CAI0778705.1 CTP pyrophosphohydrolase [Serratia proteamaculans]